MSIVPMAIATVRSALRMHVRHGGLVHAAAQERACGGAPRNPERATSITTGCTATVQRSRSSSLIHATRAGARIASGVQQTRPHPQDSVAAGAATALRYSAAGGRKRAAMRSTPRRGPSSGRKPPSAVKPVLVG